VGGMCWEVLLWERWGGGGGEGAGGLGSTVHGVMG
jgi:hypothetical protein